MATNARNVSILLPSLNSRRFLEPRVDSILRQTFTDWEAIVLDSHSTDGTWQFFESIAKTDPRFRLYQVPREGLYAALNRGLELMTGEFLYIAPSDDTMSPQFFAEMVMALDHFPDAGVAVCDCLFINQNGEELRPQDMSHRLSKRQIRNLLGSGAVRATPPSIQLRKTNYRPPPHDCLLHFTGRSVYFSLTQVLVRASLVKEAGSFETDVSSAADFGWLVRLTSLAGSLHLPKKLATWRFHGDQLSLRRDNTRLGEMAKMCENVLPGIRQRYPGLLTDHDCDLILLPYRSLLATSLIQRVGYWLKNFTYLCVTFAKQPVLTLHILYGSGFRAGMVRNFLVHSTLQRKGLVPAILDDELIAD